MPTKDEILNAIKLYAAQHGGTAPGQNKFAEATGFGKWTWYGKYWARWSEALEEADLVAHTWATQIYDDNDLVRMLADLTLSLGKYPGQGDRGLRRRQDTSFPSDSVFRERIGPRQDQLRALMQFGVSHEGYMGVYEICAPLVETSASSTESEKVTPSTPGRVYLVYSHSLSLYKIGESADLQRRYKEIQQAVPGAISEVHVLETDDPAGIERYWHTRFRSKKKINEWHDLSPADVEAFKSRGRSM